MRTRLLILCLTCSLICQGQVKERDLIERAIEVIAELNEDAEIDYTTLVDDLTAYLERPLDLNTANKDELLSLGFLTPIQVNAILDHRRVHGRFITVEELQVVDGLPMDIIRPMKVFTRVGSDLDALSISRKELFENAEQELFIRYDRIMEELKGSRPISDADLAESPNSRFLGSPFRVYTRYRFKFQNRISVGFTMEKDQGEEFFQGTQKNGFDFYSAHAYVSGLGRLDQVAIGDFQAQWGQGLVMWSGLAFGKSADLFSVKRNARGITPYRSVDENRFLRGAAVRLVEGKLGLSLFGSSKLRDANIVQPDTLDPEQAISFSSLQVSGFHRTPGEVEDKNAIRERVAGAELTWDRGDLSFGVRGVYTDLNEDFERNLQPYNQFTFNQSKSSMIGADYEYVRGNLNAFGEVARSQNGGIAAVNGAYLVLDPKLTFAALHRSYDRDYHGLFSNAIGENSTNANERGLFMGVIVRPAQAWRFSAWMDRFNFPWLRFQSDAPSDGFESMLQLNFRPNKKFEGYIRYRGRQRPTNLIRTEAIDQVGHSVQNNYRINLRYEVAEGLSLRSRLEVTDFTQELEGTSRGFIMYQDIVYRPKSSPLDLSFRYALFDTDSYDSRMYAYEQDVLYFYSIPAHNGLGTRFYALARWTFSRNVDLWVKWARWHYRDRQVISSGLAEIEGNIRTDLRMQLRLRF